MFQVHCPLLFQLVTCTMSVPLRLGERFVDYSRTDRVNTNFLKAKSAFRKAKRKAGRSRLMMEAELKGGQHILILMHLKVCSYMSPCGVLSFL